MKKKTARIDYEMNLEDFIKRMKIIDGKRTHTLCVDETTKKLEEGWTKLLVEVMGIDDPECLKEKNRMYIDCKGSGCPIIPICGHTAFFDGVLNEMKQEIVDYIMKKNKKKNSFL